MKPHRLLPARCVAIVALFLVPAMTFAMWGMDMAPGGHGKATKDFVNNLLAADQDCTRPNSFLMSLCGFHESISMFLPLMCHGMMFVRKESVDHGIL